jgi:polysaccharide export outer membrane protein
MKGSKHASEIGRSGRFRRLRPGSHRVIRIGLALLWASILSGCGAWEIVPGSTPSAASDFEVPERRIEASSFELLKQFEQAGEPVYRFGPGDELVVSVAARPEISGPHLVGPDGIITIPFAGPVLIGGLTREEAASRLVEALAPYYLDLSVTVGVTGYGSNRIVVLGRVENPGVLQFDTPPNLLETLAQAGGLPLLRPEQLLTRCAVIRGDSILWIDVARLLTGDLSLNIRLQRNDIVYIPDSTDTPVYVLGEVETPGVYRLTPQMSFLDAISQAGGPTRDANLNRIHVIRPADRVNFSFSFMEILKPDPGLNVAMKEGDIVYVPRSGISQIGYVLENFNPFSSILIINQLMSGD